MVRRPFTSAFRNQIRLCQVQRTKEEAQMARPKSLRSQLYRAARDLGNIQAAEKGPTSYGKRVVRRKVHRTTNGINQRVLREVGL
jgi:hypothetical protein